MFKTLAYLGMFVGAATLVACSSNTNPNTPVDFSSSSNGDGPAGQDLSVMKSYAMTTPHEVDVDTIGGNFGQGTSVKMSGLIVMTGVQAFKAKSGTQCKYEAWLQDPTCTTPPCGILMITQPIPFPTGQMYCPYANQSGTILATTKQGDVVDIAGAVDNYAQTATAPATGTVNQHEVDLDTINTTATGHALPTPIDVTDTNPSLFVPYSGAGWAMYEATYIKLSPPSGTAKFTVAAVDQYGNWTLNPGGAEFAKTFAYIFSPHDAGLNPTAAGGMYSSIAGIVTLTFGGSIDPIQSSDFTP